MTMTHSTLKLCYSSIQWSLCLWAINSWTTECIPLLATVKNRSIIWFLTNWASRWNLSSIGNDDGRKVETHAGPSGHRWPWISNMAPRLQKVRVCPEKHASVRNFHSVCSRVLRKGKKLYGEREWNRRFFFCKFPPLATGFVKVNHETRCQALGGNVARRII